MSAHLVSEFVEVEGLRLHYLAAGSGRPVVLLHGWPTSSFLWRNIAPRIAEGNRVIALDLPGFGRSDKPLDASYSFRFHTRILDGFFEAMGIDRLGLAVHDLGGPVGLYWASKNPERVEKLALLNTLVYPELSWAAAVFVTACKIPGIRSLLASRAGLKFSMRTGIEDPANLTEEMLEGVLEPFATAEARTALLKAGCGLHPDGLRDIARALPSFKVPVLIIYGENDRILPDVATTMERVKRDLPQAQVTSLPGCGHFLQEERPGEIGDALAEFFASGASTS